MEDYQKYFKALRETLLEDPDYDYPPGVDREGRKIQLDFYMVYSRASKEQMIEIHKMVMDYYEREIKPGIDNADLRLLSKERRPALPG